MKGQIMNKNGRWMNARKTCRTKDEKMKKENINIKAITYQHCNKLA